VAKARLSFEEARRQLTDTVHRAYEKLQNKHKNKEASDE
jgi:hypothetical protein